MEYVKNLLLVKLQEHYEDIVDLLDSGLHEQADACWKVINELEHVLELMDNDKTYQNP